MENKPTSSKTEIGWPDVLDMAGVMTMFFCYFVNKKVSHTPWLYIIGGAAAVAVGAVRIRYNNSHKTGKAKRGGNAWAAFYIFIGLAFMACGIIGLFA